MAAKRKLPPSLKRDGYRKLPRVARRIAALRRANGRIHDERLPPLPEHMLPLSDVHLDERDDQIEQLTGAA